MASHACGVPLSALDSTCDSWSPRHAGLICLHSAPIEMDSYFAPDAARSRRSKAEATLTHPSARLNS